MKRLLLLAACLISLSGLAQTIFLADTAFYTDIGYAGAEASCKAIHQQYNGWNMSRSQHQWVADAFTVPTGATWVFDTVIVYGYQYGSTTTSTFLNCNLQIYDGPPGLGGTVIWGDTSTNVLVGTGWTGIYKVDTFTSDNGLLGINRPIMFLKLYLATPPTLHAGTYWLSWSAAGSLSNSCVAPDKVLAGRIAPSGQVARGLYSGGWQYLTDSGVVNGMDMIIKARAGLSSISGTNGTITKLQLQNAPNPFNNHTLISFSLPQSGFAKIEVYNFLGQLVATPVSAEMAEGQHAVTFKAGESPIGIYLCKLQTAVGSICKQMEIVR